jgi:hypothetical protein
MNIRRRSKDNIIIIHDTAWRKNEGFNAVSLYCALGCGPAKFWRVLRDFSKKGHAVWVHPGLTPGFSPCQTPTHGGLKSYPHILKKWRKIWRAPEGFRAVGFDGAFGHGPANF